MKVERIQVQAFGRLLDLDTGGEPLGDLVVVLAPNEGGKTTLFQFLATALYGFSPASREAHPYAPWNGAEPAGITHLRLRDGSVVEVHRRLLAAPAGTLVRADRTEELRNKVVPAAEHVPAAVFRQVYAISLAELSGLEGESWDRIQDRLVAGLGAADLRPARVVADELEDEAGEIWRPHRRGNQKLRLLRDHLRELELRRRAIVDEDRSLREKVRELERTRAELQHARAERESAEVYIERFNALRPVRAALQRVRALEQEAGRPEELAALPLDPAGHLNDLETRMAEQTARLAALAQDAEALQRRIGAVVPSDLKLAERRAEVERVTARVTGAGWMRARAGQLEQELREVTVRVEAEAAELFEVPWARVDADRVRALPVGQLRTRAGDVDEARARVAAQRAAAQQLADEAARDANEGPFLSWVAGFGLLGIGVVLLLVSALADQRAIAIVGAILLGAGAMLVTTAKLRGRRRAVQPAPIEPQLEQREREALAAFTELLGPLPVRGALLERSPGRLVAGLDRIQQLLRDGQGRDAEWARLKRESAGLAEEVARLAAECEMPIPPDPVAAAHTLAAAAVEAARRQAAAERATEELARIERTRGREEETLVRLREEGEALRARIGGFARGDVKEGLRRLRARREAAGQAGRILADLERAHPDLEAMRARIVDAERAGEDWVVDDDALARRKVRLPEMTRRVETLARAEAALEQEVQHLSAAETLDRIDGEIEVLGEELRRLERERDRRYVLARVLREADRRFREEHQPELVRRAGEHLAAITGGRYTRVLLADGTGDLSFRVRSEDAPRPIPVEEPLSTGTREQVYLALRLAAVDQLDRGGERLPLFLDETLVNWDPERRDAGVRLLAEIARGRQVFVFTCHIDVAARLAEEGARIVRLDGPR